MTAEVLKALLVIMQYCYAQDSCRNCPMRELCAKMPCEW